MSPPLDLYQTFLFLARYDSPNPLARLQVLQRLRKQQQQLSKFGCHSGDLDVMEEAVIFDLRIIATSCATSFHMASET